MVPAGWRVDLPSIQLESEHLSTSGQSQYLTNRTPIRFNGSVKRRWDVREQMGPCFRGTGAFKPHQANKRRTVPFQRSCSVSPMQGESRCFPACTSPTTQRPVLVPFTIPEQLLRGLKRSVYNKLSCCRVSFVGTRHKRPVGKKDGKEEKQVRNA